jgi:hypothetical protein
MKRSAPEVFLVVLFFGLVGVILAVVLIAAALRIVPARGAEQSATSTTGYPPVGITNLRKTCVQRRDIPAAAMAAYCDCYVDRMQKTVSWRDFLLLDTAINTKGAGTLDDEEQSILGKVRETTLYCSQKATSGRRP